MYPPEFPRQMENDPHEVVMDAVPSGTVMLFKEAVKEGATRQTDLSPTDQIRFSSVSKNKNKTKQTHTKTIGMFAGCFRQTCAANVHHSDIVLPVNCR